MATGQRRCKHCGKRIDLRPQNPNQEYCKKPECQRARKRKWQRQKMKTDADYRENQREAARRWRAKNPAYWRNYRSKNDAYAQRNRQQQKLRNRRIADPKDAETANMDVSKPQSNIKPGRYQLIPVAGDFIANMDASIVEITLIQDGYARKCGNCK
jgi:type IV secretory pathway VirB10-like protein